MAGRLERLDLHVLNQDLTVAEKVSKAEPFGSPSLLVNQAHETCTL